MRPMRLAALPLAILLAGCPGLPGINGNETLSPKILAVTQTNGAGTTANAYLEWQPVTNTSLYQVYRVTGETSELATTTDRVSFTEQVQPGITVTYKIVAKDASGAEKTSSAPLKVEVLQSQVTEPLGVKVDGETPAKNLFRPTNSKPTIAWDKVANATHYYVKIDKKSDGKVLYACLTDQSQATVGSLVREDLTIPNYPQIKDQALPGEPVLFTVTAIRADDSDLAKATAIDVKPSASYEIYRQ